MSIPDEAKEGGFFHFPLCWFAEKVPFNIMLDRALGYGVAHMLDVREKSEDNEPDWVIPWRESGDEEQAYAYACEKIGFRGGKPSWAIESHDLVAGFEEQWKSEGRTTYPVRLRTDIFNDTRDKSTLSERDFRVLCAVYSAIGKKNLFKELGWQRIQWRAAGWLSKPPPRARHCGPLYPRGQIERSLSKLLDRNLVQGVTYRRGQRFWTHKLSRDGLWKAVSQLKAKLSKRDQRRAQDQQMSASIKALRQ